MQNGFFRGPKEVVILPNTIPEDPSRTPLHDLAAAGDYKALEELLINGADRNVKDSKHGNTPLHEAAWRGHSRCVGLLCALPNVKPQKESKLKGVIQDTRGALHSALLSTRNFGGFSPLHLAAQNGHNQSCREILLAGVDPNVQNNYGDTPLHTGCRYGHAGATRILLSAKCDHQRVNLNGDTPLHIAVAMGRRKLTKILLEAGSLQILRNAQNETVRDIALRKNLNEILEILDTPIDIIRRERERSSSSSRHRSRTDKTDIGKEMPGGKNDKKPESAKDNSKRPRSKEKGKDKEKLKYDKNDPDAAHWSPYGCHYFPDPRDFPSPKLETLPEEPLSKGEQYYLDLAGNIRKGPIGVGNTCYCAPFFRHLEERISKNKKTIRKYVERATEKLDSKVTALALKTDDQIGELTRSMITERIRCEDRRLHLEHWLKRGGMSRATVSGQTMKQKKDQANSNNKITRCKSLDLLDEDTFDNQIESSAIVGISRSVDILDSHDVIVHRNYSYNGENSTNNSQTSRQQIGGGDTSSGGYLHNSDKRRSSSLNYSERKTDSERDRHSMSDQSRLRLDLYNRESEQSSSVLESELGKGSSGNERDHQSSSRSRNELRDPKYVKLKVTDRLEELLVKTSEIIEMERTSRRRNQDILSPPTSTTQGDKHKKREKLKVSLSNKSNSFERGFLEQFNRNSMYHESEHHDFEDSAFIANEMEKITSSLLGHDKLSHGSKSIKMPVQNVRNEFSDSPEILKEDNSKKEDRSYEQTHEEDYHLINEYRQANEQQGSVASTSGYQPDYGTERNQKENVTHEISTSFTEDEIQHNDNESVQNIHFFNTFYQNDCFEDIPSSSSNTLKSVKHNDWKSQSGIVYQNNELELINNGIEIDVVDDSGELTEMANYKELNELKSRILNGSHWRSQVLKKSAQEYSFGILSDSENEVFKKNDIQQNAISTKYEIKNSEIKNLKSQSFNSDGIIVDSPTKNTVSSIVEKIQGTTQKMSFNHNYPTNVTNVVDFDRANDSESSEDDDDEDEIDLPSVNLKNNNGFYSEPFEQQTQLNIKPIEYNMEYCKRNYDSSSETCGLPLPYPRAQPQIANYRTGLSKTNQLARQIDTRSLIPKDAYFHELPKRNQIRPLILDNLPEKQINLCTEQMNGLLITQQQNYNARNRNPLPFNINETDVLSDVKNNNNNNPLYSEQYLPPLDDYNNIKETYIPSAINCEQNRTIKIVPQREKLLTNRKFGFTNMIDVELTRIHSQFDISTNSSTTVTPREQITIDEAQIEREMHNDSGYSTKICGSSEGASPSLSGQIETDLGINNNNNIKIDDERNLIADKYNKYYLSSGIGASSLV